MAERPLVRRPLGVCGCQFLESRIDRKNVFVSFHRDGELLCEREVDLSASAFELQPFSRLVHQNLSHRGGSDRVEVGAPAPVRLILMHELRKGFVHQLGRLWRFLGSLATRTESAVCDSLQPGLFSSWQIPDEFRIFTEKKTRIYTDWQRRSESL